MTDNKENNTGNNVEGEENPFSLPNDGTTNNQEFSVNAGAPTVKASPKKLITAIILVAAGILLLFNIIFGENNVKEKKDEKHVARLAPPSIAPAAPLPSVPIPAPIISIPEPPLPSPENVVLEEAPDNKARLERLRAGMVVYSTSSSNPFSKKKDEQNANNALSGMDSNRRFENVVSRTSNDKKAIAGRLGTLNYVIGQGKIINATLETAIDTTLPGQIRAIVTRDTYAEAGRRKLIPKGSRIIGQYNTSILRGQKRVFIVWNRVIRPDGIDIAINSPTSDALGRAGISGYLDDKNLEIFTGAMLSSVMSIGIAIAGDALNNNNNVSTTTDPNGNTTTNGSAASQAIGQAVYNIGGTAQQIMSNMVNIHSKVTIDQGTKLKIMVNKDLVFPRKIFNSGFVR